MRILVINPVGTSQWDRADKNYLERFARKGTVVTVASLSKGPKSIESYRSKALVCPEILKLASRIGHRHDAMIVNCFGDPCVEVLREVFEIPVLGAGETSMMTAGMLGDRFAVISPTKTTADQVQSNARQLGLNPTAYAVVPLKIPVLQLETDRSKTVREIAKVAKKCLADGASVIVLGCTGMAYMADEIRRLVPAPVIEPASITLKVAEALVDLKLKHGRVD
jgi:allantoin racemase